ncbi:peptidylglycine alpha-amidating monooxygenase [Polyangium spumosum]|uniref:Peptidylglycine alpha-amidating monooxygenase n=1 Tax=Polyangium spumosum TaxID=889282 RepID=A0A6N7Q035_9BACT|nr:peptidylglycine alpha-amidating monooxygenase [Polyangium spumosum]MRG95654.1 peptidylglycine alpha-amidating monooxygenase [Polyangium spumosum]
MMNTRLRAGVVLIPILLWACGGGGAATSGGGGDGAGGGGASGGMGGGADLPCDVAEIVAENCQLCHSSPPKYGAPMALVTAADFQAGAQSDPSKKVYELVGARIHDAERPMPPKGLIDASSQGVLDGWIAAGAPGASGDSCSGTGGGGGMGGGTPLSCTPDVLLRPTTAWAMPKLTEDAYVCFGAEVEVGSKRHITAIAPAVDNDIIVHHMLLYELPAAYGSTTPKACGAGASGGGRLVSVWTPGQGPLVLPEAAGLPIEGTGHYMIQMHYSNLTQLDGQKDQSGFDLCTTTNLRANDADIMAFGTTKINIPAHGALDVTCDLTVPASFPKVNTFSIGPHMHKLGTIISAEHKPVSGAPVPLTNRDPWSFDDQYWDDVVTTIGPGDTITTRCAWQNPSNSNVTFGEDTSSEMCFVFAAYYPRVELANWHWGMPALGSECQPTP